MPDSSDDLDEGVLTSARLKKPLRSQSSSDSDNGLSVSEIKDKMVKAVEAHFRHSPNDGSSESSESEYVPSSDNESVTSANSADAINTADNTTDAPAGQIENVDPTEEQCEGPIASSKRMQKKAQWKLNVQKRSRQKGQEYVRCHGPAKGTVAPAKHCPIGNELCHEKCRRNCSRKITDEVRQTIFDYYYSVDQQAKDAYLSGCIEAHRPARKRAGAEKHHTLSYQYKVKVGDQQYFICKTALCSLVCISRKVLDRIKSSTASAAAGPPPSVRGRHKKHPRKIDDGRLSTVMQHISSFPSESSHYSRRDNPDRKYLSPALTISAMYRLYKEKCIADNVEPVTEHYYRDVFKTKFNFGFGSPKSDVCSKCDSGGDTDEHKAAYHRANEEMKADRAKAKENGGPVFITFDLQQTMPLPKMPTSIAFYLRQIWFYNMGVHVVTSAGENGYMQTWVENEAGRGANEICSSLLAFFEAAKPITSQSAEHLVAWSDSCSGQNKNFTVLTFWQYLLSTEQFAIIDHKFPEVGHSYMDSDRDFGLIERSVKNVERVYSAEEYRDLIRGAKHKKPFVVQNIANGLINAKKLMELLRLVKRQRNTKKEKVEFRNVKWFRFEKFGFYKYRYAFDEGEEWKEVDIRGRHFQSSVNIDLSSSEIAMCSGRPIDAAKLADIQKQLPFIPRVHLQFYKNITGVENGSSVEDSSINSDDEDEY